VCQKCWVGGSKCDSSKGTDNELEFILCLCLHEIRTLAEEVCKLTALREAEYGVNTTHVVYVSQELLDSCTHAGGLSAELKVLGGLGAAATIPFPEFWVPQRVPCKRIQLARLAHATVVLVCNWLEVRRALQLMIAVWHRQQLALSLIHGFLKCRGGHARHKRALAIAVQEENLRLRHAGEHDSSAVSATKYVRRAAR
jgi:hypothetical protein